MKEPRGLLEPRAVEREPRAAGAWTPEKGLGGGGRDSARSPAQRHGGAKTLGIAQAQVVRRSSEGSTIDRKGPAKARRRQGMSSQLSLDRDSDRNLKSGATSTKEKETGPGVAAEIHHQKHATRQRPSGPAAHTAASSPMTQTHPVRTRPAWEEQHNVRRLCVVRLSVRSFVLRKRGTSALDSKMKKLLLSSLLLAFDALQFRAQRCGPGARR